MDEGIRVFPYLHTEHAATPCTPAVPHHCRNDGDSQNFTVYRQSLGRNEQADKQSLGPGSARIATASIYSLGGMQ
jgi:hypothetical protein